jgi:hypothetical protein
MVSLHEVVFLSRIFFDDAALNHDSMEGEKNLLNDALFTMITTIDENSESLRNDRTIIS